MGKQGRLALGAGAILAGVGLLVWGLVLRPSGPQQGGPDQPPMQPAVSRAREAPAGAANARALPPPGGAEPRVPTLALLSWRADYLAAQRGSAVVVFPLAKPGVPHQLPATTPLRGAFAEQALVGVVAEGLRVWRAPDFAPGPPILLPQPHSLARTAISADGQLVAALFPVDGGAGDADAIGLWRTTSGQALGQLRLEQGRLLGACLSPDGKLLAAFGDVAGEALLKVWRLEPGGLHEVLSWRSAVDRTGYSAAFSADSQLLALGAGRSLLLWDLGEQQLATRAATGQVAQLFPAQLQAAVAERFPPAHGLAFSPDGRRLAVLHAVGVTGAALWQIDTPAPPAAVTLRPLAWIKPPRPAGSLRQLGWDRQAQLWLVTAAHGPTVQLWRRQGDRFTLERELQLP